MTTYVKCLVTHADVVNGKIYRVVKFYERGGCEIIDEVDDNFPLDEGEFEIVPNPTQTQSKYYKARISDLDITKDKVYGPTIIDKLNQEFVYDDVGDCRYVLNHLGDRLLPYFVEVEIVEVGK